MDRFLSTGETRVEEMGGVPRVLWTLKHWGIPVSMLNRPWVLEFRVEVPDRDISDMLLLGRPMSGSGGGSVSSSVALYS